MADDDTSNSTTTTSVILLCGLPGSGKSTLAGRIIESEPTASNAKKDAQIFHIEYDAVEDELWEQAQAGSTARSMQSNRSPQDNHGVLDEGAEHEPTAISREIWKQSRGKSLALLNQYLEQAPPPAPPELRSNSKADKNNHRIILMDDNFHLRSMRREIYRICQEQVITNVEENVQNESNGNGQDIDSPPTTKNSGGCHSIYFGLIWVDTPVEICLQRNNQRSRKVPDDVVRRMSGTFEPPGKESWEQGYVRIESSNSFSLLEDVACFVYSTFSTAASRQPLDDNALVRFPLRVPPPPPPEDLEALERERQKTHESWLHSWDQRFRAWVGHVARISRRDTARANQARKVLLQRLRQLQQTINDDDGGGTVPSNEQIRDWFLSEIGTDESWRDEQLAQFQAEATIRDESDK